MTRREVYKAADDIRHELGLLFYPSYETIKRAVEDVRHAHVVEVPFESRCARGLSCVGGKHDVILIKQDIPICAKRFALAHELIHTTIHRDAGMMISPDIDARETIDPMLEAEANDGAAQLLMPYQMFGCWLWNQRISYKVDPERVERHAAALYKTSKQTAEIRIQTLFPVMEDIAYRRYDKALDRLDLEAFYGHEKE